MEKVPHQMTGAAPPIFDEIRQHTNERRTWILGRVGWVLLTVLLAVAAAGLLGGASPLNPRTMTPGARSSAPMMDFSTLAYERVVRAHTPTSLVIDVRASGPSLRARFPARIGISIARDYFTGARLLGIMPEPESSVIGDNRIQFFFATREEDQGAARVVFDFEIESLGTRSATLEVVGIPTAPDAERSRFAFRQLVLP